MKPRNFTRDEIPQHVRDRFWSKVDVCGLDDCWDWQGSVAHDRYGGFSAWIDGKVRSFKSHRFAYAMENGEVSEGTSVLHSCDNRRCCNPGHLWEGTHEDNMQDMVDKLRCSHGERHRKTTLTSADVAEIRSSNECANALAKRFHVHRTTISRIIRRKTWIHT